MKYEKQDKQSHNIINSLSLYYSKKTETILNYKCTFDLIEGKKYKRDAKASTSQRGQYGGTVHLFIGTEAAYEKLHSCPLHLLLTYR